MSLKKFLESKSRRINKFFFQLDSKTEETCVSCSGQALRQGSGQAIIEYFILLVLLAAMTIIGSSAFFSRMHRSVDNFRANCFETMGQKSLDLTWEDEVPWWDNGTNEIFIPSDPGRGW